MNYTKNNKIFSTILDLYKIMKLLGAEKIKKHNNSL